MTKTITLCDICNADTAIPIEYFTGTTLSEKFGAYDSLDLCPLHIREFLEIILNSIACNEVVKYYLPAIDRFKNHGKVCN
jgi:hypothetical protein